MKLEHFRITFPAPRSPLTTIRGNLTSACTLKDIPVTNNRKSRLCAYVPNLLQRDRKFGELASLANKS